MDKLTPKQQAFCDYYIETGNATEAAMKAGYSRKTAKSIGQENLTKPDLKEYIDARLKQKESERIASQDEVLQFLTSVLRGEITEEFPVSAPGNFQIVDKHPSVHDRTKAAELLGKRYRIWTDNVDINANALVRFVDDVPDE